MRIVLAIGAVLAGCGRLDFEPSRVEIADAPELVSCPPSYAPLGGSAHRYSPVHTGMSWFTGHATCASEATHQVIIDDAAEDTALVAYAAPGNPPTMVLWTGLSDQLTEGTWLAEDGTPATYLPWAPGQPDNFDALEDYAQLHIDGTMNDLDGASLMAVVCECP